MQQFVLVSQAQRETLPIFTQRLWRCSEKEEEDFPAAGGAVDATPPDLLFPPPTTGAVCNTDCLCAQDQSPTRSQSTPLCQLTAVQNTVNNEIYRTHHLIKIVFKLSEGFISCNMFANCSIYFTYSLIDEIGQ